VTELTNPCPGQRSASQLSGIHVRSSRMLGRQQRCSNFQGGRAPRRDCCTSALVRQRAWLSRARLPATRPTDRCTSHDPSARWPHIAVAADAVRPAPGPGALRPGARSALDMRRVAILRTSC